MLHAGDVLAQRYRLRERVGGGGMGDVWRGEDMVLGRTVAVKVLRADRSHTSNFRERFRREARAVANLEGPGIVEVHDYGETKHHNRALAFLVMRYVDGMSLSRRLAIHGRIGTLDTLEIVAQVADALDIAHRNGIIHRDVKPGNILVPDDGRVTLVDFGIARTNVDITLTTAGVILGTVRYMSPEQAAGQRLSPTSDVYSLGVVAHQCITGQPPYEAASPLAVLSAHMRGDPPRIPDDVAPGVRDLIMRAMASQPRQRFTSAAELATACRTLLRRPAAIEPPPPEVPPASTVKKDPMWTSRPASGRSPVSGSRPAPEPPRPPQSAAVAPDAVTLTGSLEHPPARQRRGGSWIIWSAALLVASIIGFVLLVEPGNEGRSSARNGSQSDADMRPGSSNTADANAGRVEDQDNGGSDSQGTKSDAPGQPSRDGHSHGSSSASPSSRLVRVPDVMYRPESQAEAAVTDADLAPSVVYQGEGEVTCEVVAQEPTANEEVKPQSTVTVTVRRTAESC